MKNLCLFISLSLLFSYISAKDVLQSNSSKTSFKLELTKIPNPLEPVFVTYGMGSNGGYILKDEAVR